MQNVERPTLQPAQVSRVYKFLEPHIDGAKKTEVLASVMSWGRIRHQLSTLVYQRDSSLNPILEDISHAEAQIALADENIEATRNFVNQPQRRLRGQFGALLGRLKPWGEHPWITSINAEKKAVEAFMSNTQTRLHDQRTAQEKNLPLIKSAKEELTEAEDRLFTLWEGVAVRDMPLTTGYLRIIPERTNPLVERYGETFYLDPQRVPDIGGFTAAIAPYVQNYSRIKGYQALAEGQLPLLEIPAADLPRPVKEALQGWTAFYFASELYRLDLLSEEPKLSNFLKT